MNERNVADSEDNSVKHYAAKVFRESSVGMVSSLTHASGTKRRVFKVFVFILCLSGFLYQSARFVEGFLQYQTNINLHVTRPNTVKVPAFTFCDNNG